MAYEDLHRSTVDVEDIVLHFENQILESGNRPKVNTNKEPSCSKPKAGDLGKKREDSIEMVNLIVVINNDKYSNFR